MNRLFRSATTWSAFAVVGFSTIGVQAAEMNGRDFGPSGIVGELAIGAHLDPLTADEVRNTEFKPAAYSIDAQPRLSMPAVDRSRSLVLENQFPNTKSIVPLLVSDMDLNAVAVDRPMSARSVGARPSLPLARPLTRTSAR